MKRPRANRLTISSVIALAVAASASAEDWPQWRGPNRDGVWNETGLIESFPKPQIDRKWTAPIGSGYSGPTVAAGRVYVTDRVDRPTELERVHCFDAESGEALWTHEYECSYSGVSYPAGPRASVLVDQGRAFALGTRGHFHCLDAVSGEVLWKHDMETEYQIEMPIWGIAASPIVFADLVIVQIGGADGACMVALDKATGQERWRALGDRASYSAPIILQQAGQQVLVVWTGDSVTGLDPASGEVYWTHPFKPQRMVINIATPVVDGNRMFFSSFYDGSMMLELASDSLAVESTWQQAGPDEKNTKALHSIISTPYLEGDYVYGVDSYGELRCLDAKTGDRIWEDLTATPPNRWSTIHMVRNGDKMWMFNEAGELLIGRLAPTGFTEISRAKLIDPTIEQLRRREGVCWAHPAYANRHVFARNDKELVCASLAAE